jgi:predicted RNA-binding Zn ribbon-like protein
MLQVTWEWLGAEAALDVANTIAVSDGVERDLLAPAGGYERWATAASSSPELDSDQARELRAARPRVLELREPVRRLLAATAAGEPPPKSAVAELNGLSRKCPVWPELGPEGELRERVRGSAADRLLATYARSALKIAAEGPARLRVCPAPSCGMYYRPGRSDQRWCSVQCGTRARVARHAHARRAARISAAASISSTPGSG